MSNHVLMFEPRFADLVKSGAKPHTIRGPRKRPIKAGDTLSLRMWSGKPYGSKQVVLREVVVSKVCDFAVVDGSVVLWEPSNPIGYFLLEDEADEIAHKDGFNSLAEMLAYLGDKFTGNLITWEI